MTDRVEIRRLEQYLFAKNKEEFLKGLVQGNYDTSYLNLLHIFNTKGKFDGADKKLLDSFLEQHGKVGGSKIQNIFDFRHLLSEFELAEGNQSKQEEVLEKIRERYFTQLRFHYNKPSNIGKTNVQKKDQDDGLKSTIDESTLSFDSVLEKIYNSPNLISRLHRNKLSKVDFTKASNKNKRQLLEFYNHLLSHGDIENWGDKLVDLVKLYADEYKSQNKNQNYIPRNIVEKATLEQIQQLQNKLSWLKNDRSFQETIFRKTFLKLDEFQSKRNISELTIEQKTQYRSLILEVIEWCKNQKNVIFQSLQDQMLYGLLVIDRELEAYNKELFLQYIQKPFRFQHCQLFYNFTDSHQKVIRDLKQEFNHWGVNLVDIISENTLVEDYLQFFFRDAKDTTEFSKYFQEHYLRRIFFRVKLQLGETFENISEFLSSSEVEDLTKKKEITICRSNNRFFKAGEEIKLNVDIKNIKSMNVKVFEINTENYYIKKKSAFDNSINLEGINPLDQQVNLQFSDNPIIRKRHEFKFERLTAIQRGVFVIEFIGNGISSRAVIRKGALNYLEQKTLAGHEITLITEDQNICKPTEENNTGIWLDDRFLKVNENGKITIPYGDSSRTATAILVHNNFAELSDVRIQSEEYSFKVAYLYNSETFLGGNKAKIIAQPRLFINGIPCSMKLIEDAQIAAVLVNEQNISNNYNFKNLKLSPTEDIVVEIPIQNLVRSIELKFTGRIKKLNGNYQNLNSNMEERFNLYESSSKLDNIYLRNTKDGYFLNILGKNGEPKQGQMVDFTFNLTFSNDSQSVRAKTDEKGQIKLGKLVGIFSVLARYSNQSQQWQIQRDNQIQYPSNVVITEADEFSLPALSSEINLHTYSLTEIKNQYNLNAHLSKIVYNNNRIVIKGLAEGDYLLKVKESNSEVRINVIKGGYWTENDQFIVSEKQNAFIQRTISVDQSLAILNCKVEEQKKLKLKVLLPENVGQQGALDLVRVHVIAYNYLSQNQDNLSQKLRIIQGNQSRSEIQFGMKKSVFLNNAKLGDEICYVLERQNQKKYIGNTLEKPNILLKRTFVRDTNFDKEELSQDQAYASGLEDKFVNEKAMRREVEQQIQNHSRGYGYAAERSSARYGAVRETGTDSMLNFLKNPCYVKCNVKVDQNGECVIEDFPADQYSSVQIILNNLSACVSNDFVIEEIKEVSYKDLRLKSQLKAGEAFLEQRGSKMVLKGEKTNIPSGAECVIIDNIAQFFDIQKQLKLTTSSRDSENDRGYVFWDFLKNWNILSEAEKLKKYDEFACHEVNIFLYMKDREFFERVVYNFIQNKLQKSFVDYFLLNDKEQLLSYANPQNINSINYMERCLLISHLAQNGQEQQAQSLQKALEMESINYPQDTQLRNRLFDTVISAKQQQAAAQQQQQFQRLQQQQEEMCFKQSAECDLLEMEEEARCFNAFSAQPQMETMSLRSAAPQMMMKKKMAAPTSLSASNTMMMGMDSTDRQIQQRKEFKPGYQKLKKTKEYIERTYYNMKNASYQKDHITYSDFWVKFASHIIENQGRLSGFIDESFIYATQNHADMICALAFTALEFEGGSFEMKAVEDRQIEIKGGRGNVVIFLKNIVQSRKDLKAEISINQRFFDPSDRYIYLEDDPTVQVEKTVEEFLPSKIYGLKYIVTNCSIASLEFQILTEIPEGSLPVNSVYYTKSHTMNLASYQTQQIEILFYFPEVGSYKCFPANVSRNGTVWAEANNVGEIVVKPELTIKKMDNFQDIIRNGSQEDILKFVAEKNIKNTKVFRFSDIYWLLKDDKAFYLKFIEILGKRKIFDLEAWALSLYHKVPSVFVELFENRIFQQSYMRNYTNIRAINTKLFKINEVTIFEYHPLLSSRAHSFMNESKSKILNVEFKQTYEKFLQYLVEKPQPDVCDLLTFSYYLLLQERIEESIQIFESIKSETLAASGRIQYDYMAAYLNIYNGYETNFSVAREVAKKYINYPIQSWRNLFVDLNNQLREFDGEVVEEQDQVKEAELNKNLKAGKEEEEISYELDKQEIVVTYQNISSFQVFYYEVDLEILFSRTPFINQIRDDFAFVKANKQDRIALEKSNLIQTTRVKIPSDLANKNLYILLKSNNNVNNIMYFSNNLKVQLIKNYGQVKVLNDKNLPQSKVYVKCFARQNNGEEYFYRDGYTDLRGRFDYALSSSSDVDKISKFSILISSENHGAIIKEVGPPSKLGRIENEEEE